MLWEVASHLPAATEGREFRGVKRGLTINEAAEYCGVSVSAYRSWMNQGIVPIYWPGTRRIERLALDDALDKMSGRGKPAAGLSKYDAWKAGEDAA